MSHDALNADFDLAILLDAARAAGIPVPPKPEGSRPTWVDHVPAKPPVEPRTPDAVRHGPGPTTVTLFSGTVTLAELRDALRDHTALGSPGADLIVAALDTVPDDVLNAFGLDYDSDDGSFDLDGPNPGAATWEATKAAHEAAVALWRGERAAWVRQEQARREADRQQLLALAPWTRWDKFIRECRRAADAQHDPQVAAMAALGRAFPEPPPNRG